MKKVLWVLAVAATLFFAFIAFGLMVETPEGDAMQDAERTVESQLKDGNSAEFRNVAAFKDANGRITVCGEVNGRNSFGAMAGFRRFVYFGGPPAIIEQGSDGEIVDGFWSKAGCDGVPLKREH